MSDSSRPDSPSWVAWKGRKDATVVSTRKPKSEGGEAVLLNATMEEAGESVRRFKEANRSTKYRFWAVPTREAS